MILNWNILAITAPDPLGNVTVTIGDPANTANQIRIVLPFGDPLIAQSTIQRAVTVTLSFP